MDDIRAAMVHALDMEQADKAYLAIQLSGRVRGLYSEQEHKVCNAGTYERFSPTAAGAETAAKRRTQKAHERNAYICIARRSPAPVAKRQCAGGEAARAWQWVTITPLSLRRKSQEFSFLKVVTLWKIPKSNYPAQ